MQGKRILITGATNGIGKQSALELARMGAEIVIVGRDEVKTRKVSIDIKQLSGNSNIDLAVGDLSSMDEVRRIASEYRDTYGRLDVLLNNAGASFSTFETSVDGYEKTFALNHLSYYLLTNLLLDTIKLTARDHGEARIINVSSSAHTAAGPAGVRYDELRGGGKFRAFRVYGGSKLANVLFTYELARRLEGADVTVNAVHPGLVNTGFGDNMTGFMRYFFKLMKTVAGRSPRKGAETLVYLASSPDVQGVTGKYWFDKKAVSSSDKSYDREQQTKLWEFSAAATGLD